MFINQTPFKRHKMDPSIFGKVLKLLLMLILLIPFYLDLSAFSHSKVNNGANFFFSSSVRTARLF